MLTEVKAYGTPAEPLVLSLESEDYPFQVLDIQGISPVKANVNTTPLAQGELFTGSSSPKRNIVITLGLNPDWSAGQSYESLGAQLYQYFMPQDKVKLRFTSTHMPTVEIDGVVEDCAINKFSQDPQYVISIINPDPDFIGITEQVRSGITNAADAPLNYQGTVPTGFLLTIQSTVTTPAYNGIYYVSIPTGSELFYFSGQVDSARVVELSSIKKQKFTRQRTVDSNVIKSLLSTQPRGVPFPQITKGATIGRVWANNTGMAWTLKYHERFGGL